MSTLVHKAKNETAVAICCTALNLLYSESEEKQIRFEAVEYGDGYYHIYALSEVDEEQLLKIKAQISAIGYTYNTMRGIHPIDTGGQNV